MAADELGRAVGEWLAALDPTQRSRAAFSFEADDRFAWQYTPGHRAGLAFGEMTGDQRAAAMAIVRESMSTRGARDVEAIIDLEPILGALERAAGATPFERDPALYWFAVFGDPAADDAPWAWRVGGHHLLVHATVVGGRVAFPPSFLGANPAVVPSGPRRGFRALTGEEMLARAVLGGLSAEQRAIAIVDPVAPPDIRSGHGRRADLASVPIGIRHDALEPEQQAALQALIRHYLGRARDEVAAEAWARIEDAGLAEVTFAWAGPTDPGRGHYYAVRGPHFLLEYDNTQNGANHIHSVWRDLANDWGEDTLAVHYRAGHAANR